MPPPMRGKDAQPRPRKRNRWADEEAGEEREDGRIVRGGADGEEEDDVATKSDEEFIDDGHSNDHGYSGPMCVISEEDKAFEARLAALQSGKKIRKAWSRSAVQVYSDSEEEPQQQPQPQPEPAKPQAVRQPVKGGFDRSFMNFVAGKAAPVAKVPQPAPEPPPKPIASLFTKGVQKGAQPLEKHFAGKRGIKMKQVAAAPPREKLPGIYFRNDGTSYRLDENGDVHEGPDV